MTTSGLAMAVLALLLGVGIVLLHKVRRMHLMLYEIRRDSEAAQKESAALFGQMQAFLTLERMLQLPAGLPPLRGWAGSPDMLLQVAERTLSAKPKVVLECSSGASTIVAARCCQLNGQGHVFSLEHDEAYAEKTRAHLARQGLQDWATVVHAPLTADTGGGSWYDERRLPPEAAGAEMLVVDGPPAGGESMARYPALPRLRHRLAERFTLLLDDADRPGERAVVKRWLAEDPRLAVDWLPCEKGLAVLEPRA